MNDPNFSLMDVVLPVGAVTAFVGDVASYQQSKGDTSQHTTAPIESFGWMLCDGSSLKASEYPELYSALGDLYGSSGSGKDLEFNLPDLRGLFLRGIGTDIASIEDRTKAPGGKEDGVGSIQKDALQKHQHVYTKPTGTPAPGESAEGTATVNTEAYTGPPTSETDKSAINVSQYETRPVNVFVNYLIKYTYKLPKFNHFPQV